MNPFDVLKQLQDLPERMQRIQETLTELRVTGSAGGGMVEVEVGGDFSVHRVKIDPEVVDPNDVALLEDLVRAALTNALGKLRTELVGKLQSGLFPPLLGGV